jgi:hypothetical protein
MRVIGVQLINGGRFSVDASSCGNVGELRALISDSLAGEHKGHPIKLVAGGRVLRNDSESLDSARIADGFMVHAMLDRTAAPRAEPAEARAGEAAPHRGEGSVRGLNRLLALGVPQEDVDMLRSIYMQEIRQTVERLPGSVDTHSRWGHAEDMWLAAQPSPLAGGPLSEIVANLQPWLQRAAARGLVDARCIAPSGIVDPAVALGIRASPPPVEGAPEAAPLLADRVPDEDDFDPGPPVERPPQQSSFAVAVCSFLLGLIAGFFGGIWVVLFMGRGGQGRHWFLIGCLLGAMLSLAEPMWPDKTPSVSPTPRLRGNPVDQLWVDTAKQVSVT